jgi:hypothetical protein
LIFLVKRGHEPNPGTRCADTVLCRKALLLSLKLGNAELRVERSSYSVKANIRLYKESVKVVIKLSLAKGY